ncbi:MAG: hypothetical protein MJZ75_06495 [Paludibacteraceae bacterium]|nr:hypothetical protein [Paludibacteraceae bacterium]
MKSIFKIIFVSDPYTLTKKDGTTCLKQTITLREIGGKYENQFVATWLGDQQINLNVNTTIAASLRFSVRTFEGQDYQDITLQEFVVLNYMPKLPTIPSIPAI